MGLQEELKEAVAAVRNGMSERAAAAAYGVPKTTIHRNLTSTPSARNARGRPPRLLPAEEKTIADAATEFALRGTPLSRMCLAELAQTYIQVCLRLGGMPSGSRTTSLALVGLGSSLLVTSLVFNASRHWRTREAEAMDPRNIAAHFARLNAMCTKHRITNSAQVFNLDKTGFSLRERSKGRVHVVTPVGRRANSLDLKFSGSVDRITLMPVVSADGRAWNPVVVLPGTKARWRRRPDREGIETPADFLPAGWYVHVRTFAGVDSEIFENWATKFISETAHLRKHPFESMLLVLNGFSVNIQYRALKTLKEGGVHVVALPAHTSHRTQPLDVSVFGPMKTAFRSLTLCRTIATTQRAAKNDIYTLCKLVREAYRKSMTMTNIVAGFRRTGIWCEEQRGPNWRSIEFASFSSSAASEANQRSAEGTGKTTFGVYYDLVSLFSRSRGLLVSDGAVLESGRLEVSTKTGGTLTRDNVTAALLQREERRVASEREKEQRLIRAEESRAARKQKKAQEAARKRQREAAPDSGELQLQTLKERWDKLARCLLASRQERR